MPYNALFHAHADMWIVVLLLFLISYILVRYDKVKAQKITHMILRLFFVIMFLSGLGLVITYKFMLMAIVKMLFGIWLIASMELILVRARKGKSTVSFWIQFMISLIAVLIIGYRFI
ncbi:DUF1516 family protein [Pueribacillus sp. YX66]|uniref:DUF1516 family protein n=1 Tax=Pueribacillus sp. YX66 TaxID=3229242 RepID=UPI00358D5489